LQHASIGALPHPGQLPRRYRTALPWRKPLPQAERLAMVERPGIGRLIVFSTDQI